MKRTLPALFAASALLTTILAARAERIDTAPLPPGTVASRVFIDKSERTLTLFRGERELKTYKVALGRNPVGHKQQEGDGRTPEGRYKITFHKENSSFHRALRISYPNAEDVQSARERGVSPGGDIMIHGLPNGMGSLGSNYFLRDWTEGCIAVTNEEIEEIWRAVPDGTIVEIKS
jgi:murein L,D-transpeptidase YafK